ncbi:hypothetical protein [Streptomyces sp. CB02261]|uniref:hypothetical protein n=1 Tax=Streptomyces sp. CB02261 TaxID=1703940 RepID=UPI000939800F|nr:hypothetical protein [Streptomyces sp. CB02261]OKJ64040.1 hypothetical protein AMK29_18295 [Streptomyces sp. CB02261]
MITLSVDPTSQGFAEGQALGTLLVTAVAMAVVWFTTRAWRRGPVPTSAVGDAERAVTLAIRRGNIIRGVLLAVAAAGLVRAVTYEGEPPAASAAPVVQEPTAVAPSVAAAPSAPGRVIDAAPHVGAYRLLTGAEAAEYEQLMSGKSASGKRWFYDGPGAGPMGAVLQINAVEWDEELAEAKRSDTMTQELRDFFAGARATEVTAFEAGPWGGRLSCGFLASSTGRPVVCAWTDSGTWGNVLLADEKTLPEAAEAALRFRTISEKRT